MINIPPATPFTSSRARLAIREDPESMILALWMFCGFQSGDLSPDCCSMAGDILHRLNTLQETTSRSDSAAKYPFTQSRREAVTVISALWHFCDLDFSCGHLPAPAQAAAEIAAFVHHLRDIISQAAGPAARPE